MEKGKLIIFWKKFFEGCTAPINYMQILEMMIRGKNNTECEEKSRMFASNYQKMMARSECLGDNKKINIEKLGEAFENDTIDIHILSKALSGKLDQSFFSPLFDGQL